MKKFIYVFFLIFAFSIQAREIPHWNESYFLPTDHPLKAPLDEIFTGRDVLRNSKTLKEAGFQTLFRQGSKMRVVSHSKLPGYLVKLYLDELSPDKGSKWLFDRCKGAENVRNVIEQEKLKYIVVPQKFIYQIPGRSFSTRGEQAGILIVERMPITSRSKTREAWQKAGPKQLDDLYAILSRGFSSPALVLNVPSMKDGRFTCIDTEYVQRDLALDNVRKYFSLEMQLYWYELLQKDGRL